jgi:hypothetical protein
MPTARAYWVVGLSGLIGASFLWVAQMGFNAQDRQYSKTLKYMHEGRERGKARMMQQEQGQGQVGKKV